MAPSKRVRAPRKSTVAARREEIAALQAELQALRTQWRQERRRLRTRPIQNPISSGSSESVRLHEAVHSHHLQLAGLSGLLNAHQIVQRHRVLHLLLRLPSDPAARRETLLGCLSQKIADARSFILHHSAALDLQHEFRSLDQFPDPASGDLCTVHFEVTPCPGVQSVRKVFDAVRYWANHLEICISERLGSVTIREDAEDDDSAPGCSLRRIASSLGDGVSLEANVAVFRRILSDREALVTIQGVDADELYAFRPSERVRIEVTGVMRVARTDSGVTLVRWATVRLHAGAAATPKQLQLVLSQSTNRWVQVVRSVIHERVYAEDDAQSGGSI